MAQTKHKEMTADEFFLWCKDQEERYELVDGFPVPLRGMAGASTAHDLIVVNIIGHLFQQLRGSNCRPTTPDTAVRTSINRFRRPDVTIECAPPDAKSYEARNPIAVFEVLSPGSRKNDRNVKLQEYMRHSSLRTIVHIDPDLMDVLVYGRGADGQWNIARLEQAAETVGVADTPVALALADIYDGVPLPLAAETSTLS